MTFDEHVDEICEWWLQAPKTVQQEFKDTPKDRLISYYNTLGRTIRNKFNLWERPWTEEIVDGIDISPEHPEAISMRLIEAVWEKVNKRD